MVGVAQTKPQRLVLVTGPSGAGRSTAIHALEDLGFEAIDNLPFGLLDMLIAGPPIDTPLALGLDARNRDFSTTAFVELLSNLRSRSVLDVELLFVDCAPHILSRRYSETRRRHPIAPNENPEAGIAFELDLLGPIKELADFLIDTSELTPHRLRTQIEKWFATEGQHTLSITVTSFSYKRGIPQGMDMVFDCRFLHNPHWDPELRALDGRDARVADQIAEDVRLLPFVEKVTDLAKFLLPAYQNEGRSHVALGFGCTGGQHRSVFVAQTLGESLAESGWRVSIRHREITRREDGAKRTSPTG